MRDLATNWAILIRDFGLVSSVWQWKWFQIRHISVNTPFIIFSNLYGEREFFNVKFEGKIDCGSLPQISLHSPGRLLNLN